MLPNGQAWHYLAAKKIIKLLKGITSKHYGNFYCLNCLKSQQHIPSGISMSAISSFRSTEYKHEVYRSKDCMIKFCVFLRVHAMKK